MAAIRTGMGCRVVKSWDGIVRDASIQGYFPLLFTGDIAPGIFGDIGSIGKNVLHAVGRALGAVDNQAGTHLNDGVTAYQHPA